MKSYKSIFAPFMERLLTLKKGMGFKSVDMHYSFSMFDRFVDNEKLSVPVITREISDKWSIARTHESPRTRYVRIAHVAQLSAFLGTVGYPSYITKLPRIKHTHVPYIFSKEQMNTLFTVTDKLMIKCSRHKTSISAIPALFRMLYSTGIRTGEALALRDADVDITNKTLFIKGGKNGCDRRIPITGSLAQVCADYKNYRDRFTHYKSSTNTFFRTHDGRACPRRSVYTWFRRIIAEAKISHLGKGMGPRVHDVRHTYSVHALAKMIEEGMDLYYALPVLSTCLGHKSLDATEQYVRLTSEMHPGIISDLNALCSYVFPKKIIL